MGQDLTHPEVRRAVERELGTILTQPKYGSGDFARTEYRRHRGKLDVPKEGTGRRSSVEGCRLV